MSKDSLKDTKLKGEDEDKLEHSLRPKKLSEVIGLEQQKKNLEIMIGSAKARNTVIDHLLFHGPPGLGKTTLAFVTAYEMGAPLHVTNGSVLQKGGDLAAILTSLEEGSILFIDEIHRMRKSIEELLYPAMEDFVLDIIIGKGPSAKNLRLPLPKFTLIGATTKLSMLSNPLRDRFGMHFKADFYSNNELCEIIKQKSKMIGVDIDDDANLEIAKRSRMTPRISIRILKRAYDLVIYKKRDHISIDEVIEMVDMMRIDDLGLDQTDRDILRIIGSTFENRPVGIKTLSAAISEEPDTIENVHEPFLLKIGLLKKTPRGRVVTSKGLSLYSLEQLPT